MDAKPVYLTGLMGAGKSSVGRALAARLGRAFVDTDALVEQTAGRTIDRIIRESGEGAFRALEERVLHELGDAVGTVVSTGGGLFLGASQRAHMKRSGTVVWLDIPLRVAAERVAGGVERPLWPAGDAVSRTAWFDRRRVAYALAHARIDANAEIGVVVDRAERVVRRLEAGASPGDPP